MSKAVPSTGWNPKVQAQIDAAFVPKPPRFTGYDGGVDGVVKKLRASKYNNKRTTYTSTAFGFVMHCDSMAEAKYAAELDLRVKAGEVFYWLPHVRFPLPGGEVYECDFYVIERYTGVVQPESRDFIKVIDVKGRDTPASKAKRAFVQATYGVAVEVVGRGK